MQTPTAIARSAATALADGGTPRDRTSPPNPPNRRFDAILHVIEVVLKDMANADPATRMALTRLTEALARIVNLPQQPQESLRDFTRRLAAHMDVLPPQARALIEKQLGQQSLLVALKMLIETLRPSLPSDIMVASPAHHETNLPQEDDRPAFRHPTIQAPLPIRPLQSHPSSVMTGTVKLQQALELAFSGEPPAKSGTSLPGLQAGLTIDEPLPAFREVTAFLASDLEAVTQAVAITRGQAEAPALAPLPADMELPVAEAQRPASQDPADAAPTDTADADAAGPFHARTSPVPASTGAASGASPVLLPEADAERQAPATGVTVRQSGNQHRQDDASSRAGTPPAALGIDRERSGRPQRELQPDGHSRDDRHPISEPMQATHRPSADVLSRPPQRDAAMHAPAQLAIPLPQVAPRHVPEMVRDAGQHGSGPGLSALSDAQGMAENQGVPPPRDAGAAVLRPVAKDPDGFAPVAADKEDGNPVAGEPGPDLRERRLDVTNIPANVPLQSLSAMDVVGAIGQLDEWETLFYMLSGSLSEASPPDAEPDMAYPAMIEPDSSPEQRARVSQEPTTESPVAEANGDAVAERVLAQSAHADDMSAAAPASYGPETVAVREALGFAFVPYLPAPSRMEATEEEEEVRHQADDRPEEKNEDPQDRHPPEGETREDADRDPRLPTETDETDTGAADAYDLYRRLSGLA